MEERLGALAKAYDDGADPRALADKNLQVTSKLQSKEFKSDMQKSNNAKQQLTELRDLHKQFTVFAASMNGCLTDPRQCMSLQVPAGQPVTWLNAKLKSLTAIVARAHKLACTNEKLAFPERTSNCRKLLEQADAKLRGIYKFEQITFDALDAELRNYRDCIGYPRDSGATASTSKTLAPPQQMRQLLPSSSGSAHPPQGFNTDADQDQQVS